MASTSPSTDATGTLRSLVWLATAATTVTAAWLIGVSIAVLPDRDPAHVGFWLAVGAALLAFAALTGLHLTRWGGSIVRWLAGRRDWLRRQPARGSQSPPSPPPASSRATCS